MKIVNVRTGAEAEVSDGAGERRVASGRWRKADGPTASDVKPVWVDHAVAQGADRDEAEAMTKAQLVEQFGG
jgi:hypothetical protein